MKGATSQNADFEKARDAQKAEAEALRKQVAAAADTIQTLQNELGDSEKQRRDLEAQLGKAGERQTAIEAELAEARAAVARLTEEKERLQRELDEARAEIERRDAQKAAEEELGAALLTDVDVVGIAPWNSWTRNWDGPITDPLLDRRSQ